MKAKWIGGILGFVFGGGILGGIAGYALGSLFDSSHEDGPDPTHEDTPDIKQQRSRNNFLFSLMVLSAHMIQADGKIMHSEMEFMRRFLQRTFGEDAKIQGNDILLRLFEYRKQQGEATWREQIMRACEEIATMMPEAERTQLATLLAEIARADGHIDATEVSALREIIAHLRLNPSLTEQLLSLGGTTLEDAYRILGLTPDATDAEVRSAYRKLVVENHPDKVAHLGEDVKAAATKKLQQITEAKELIDKMRKQ